jgi:hypothetical protein
MLETAGSFGGRRVELASLLNALAIQTDYGCNIYALTVFLSSVKLFNHETAGRGIGLELKREAGKTPVFGKLLHVSCLPKTLCHVRYSNWPRGGHF